MPPKERSDLVGTQLNERYRIDAVLGQGSMGEVYRARDILLKRDVAVKVLSLPSLDTQGRTRFLHEAQFIAKLNHPNIVSVHDAGEHDDLPFIIMELVEGQTLHEARPDDLDTILSIAVDICSALRHAHAQGIIHRDIKPENVVLDGSGRAKLMDFGIAFSSASRLTETGTLLGTVFYISPEQALGKEIDQRADLYSLGVLLYELVCGRLPFEADDPLALVSQHLHAPVVPPDHLNPEIPPSLSDLILKLLAKQPAERPESASDVQAELQAVALALDTGAEIKAALVKIPKTSKIPSHEHDAAEKPSLEYAVPHNLPLQLTPFIGREYELKKLARLIKDPRIRLVTVLAAGGMGKSRLALEMARRIVDDGTRLASMSPQPGIANGVYYISLAPLTDITTIVPTIAQAVGFHFYGGGEPKKQLLDYLREKEMLLLLDNFEHLLEGAGLLSEILAAAPSVQLLVTSRERLRLQEETLLRIEGMEFPDWQTPEEALGYGATRLFLQSARRVQPGFQLQPTDIQYVSAICRQVQGMPLAIVLAAAWVEVLSLAEITAEITRCLDFLEADVQNIPDRHRSIRAVFNPTWNRLDETEQVAFQKLSVFRGGFTREAAQAVAGSNLRQLTVLLGKSLLRRDPSGRYDIHELLRQYAEEHLRTSPDLLAETHDLHCAHYAGFLQACEYDLSSERQLEAAADFKTNLDNIRLAWSWACQYAKAKEINRMAYSLYWGFLILSLDVELGKLAEEAILSLEAAEATEQGKLGLAKALFLQCVPAMRLGQIDKAKAAAERSWLLIETLNLEWRLDPRMILGIVNIIQGNFAAAERFGEQMRQDYEAIGNRDLFVDAFYVLTIASLAQGKFETARTFAEQTYTYVHETGNRWMAAYVLNEWGNTARALGDYDEARERYQKSYDIHRDFNDSQGMGDVLNHLANIALLQENFSESEQYYRESVTLNREMGNRGGIAAALEGLGNVMLSKGDYQQAEYYLIEALSTAGSEIVQFSLSILVGLGELWIRTGQYQRGGELLAFVLHNPASTQEIKGRVKQLKVKLGEKAMYVVWASDKTLDLETMVQELLASEEAS